MGGVSRENTGCIWVGFMSFPHSFNDFNLRKFVYCKNDPLFYYSDWRNKQRAAPNNKKNVVLPGCVTVGVSYAAQVRFMSYLFRIQVSCLWQARFTCKLLEEAISSWGAQITKKCRRRCYEKESVFSLTIEKNQLVLRIPTLVNYGITPGSIILDCM